MKPIERGEILGLAEYEQVRERFRGRVIEAKKRRRVVVGPKVSVVFENRDTVLLQIQEMLRTERITRADAVQHELDTYNELLPGQNELSCTLMVEIADKAERDAFLAAAKGLEKHVWLVAGSLRMGARSIERGLGLDGVADRTTAVHYLKFSVPARLSVALHGAAAGEATMTHLELAIDHPAYEARAPLPAEAILEVGQDLGA
ncbi:MAG TPA: DUF3501 family protein [Polyangiaceae bacterium]